MPGKVGRPRKNALAETTAEVQLDQLGINPALLEADLTAFFRSGKPQRLQRWFTARDAETADLIAAHMVAWLQNQIADLMPLLPTEVE